MWRRVLSAFFNPSAPIDPRRETRLVSDEAYDFGFETTPKLPVGLRDLKITEFRPGLLLLENFHIDLMIDQSHLDISSERIAMASRCLRWAKSYHGLAAEPEAPVRLHNGNVLLCNSLPNASTPFAEELSQWLDRMQWQSGRQLLIQEAVSDKPLHSGFFRCLRINVGDVSGNATGLEWQPGRAPRSTVAAVADFAEQELAQRYADNSEQYLRNCYTDEPADQLTHPAFALLHFPHFDMGQVRMTLAGSVWSPQELFFWSRPTYLHN